MASLPSFENVRVLCIGDLMLDRFAEGVVDRISPESPVPIVRLRETRSIPGGAANVGRNVAALGGAATLIGTIGNDAIGEEMTSLVKADQRLHLIAVVDALRPTTEKTRFVAHGQHMLRVDREQSGDISDDIARLVLRHIQDEIDRHDIVVLSDYAKGLLTDNVVRGAIEIARGAGVSIVVDPKSARFERYAGATVITPNVAETAAATGIYPFHDHDADQAARVIADRFGIQSVLLTRAERGMSLRWDDRTVHVSATARDVFDVVGAGDTVVATLALAIGAELNLEAAARLANTAAGIAVGKQGTATVTRAELLDELAKAGQGDEGTSIKILQRAEAVARCAEWGLAGLKVGFTNGCFDILHAGHVRILEFARAHCDRLVIGLNDDASVRRLKGSTRPVNATQDRAEVLAALTAVDAVVVFAEDTPAELIEALQPDLLVKGADYQLAEIVGADTVVRRGGEVLTFDLLQGRSSSRIIARASDGLPK